MNLNAEDLVESQSAEALARAVARTAAALEATASASTTATAADAATGQRLDVRAADVRRGLGQLVVTLVKLIHELLERQALRRIDSGRLTDAQIEAVGVTLMKQAQEIDRLKHEFGLTDADLNLDLGPLGRLV